MTTHLVRHLDSLTPTMKADLARMTTQMQRRLEEVRMADTPATRREAGEWVLRVAADIYAWSH